MRRFHELFDVIKTYDPNADENLLKKAYVYAMKAHSDQRRANGDPYFSHPIEVAYLLSELKLDIETIAAGLLHDTLEDTDATENILREMFGDNITQLVKGVTKLSKADPKTEQLRQAENFRKLMMALADDVRVLLIKLADRLHNIRTISYIKKEEKRKRIARETLDIHAPLAERLGIEKWKNELEDRSFAEIYTDMYQAITERLKLPLPESIEEIEKRLDAILSAKGIKVTIKGRRKTPYSIWRKMEQKGVKFEEIADIQAFRIFVDEPDDCYKIMGILHQTYQSVPGRIKDFISMPKPNGYQSLHTTLIGPSNHKIEIQIRTWKMHEIAEKGIAAHWNYKQTNVKNHDGRKYKLIRELIEDFENSNEPAEFLRDIKIDLYGDQVFVFAPDGEVFMLEKDSTVLDFAFLVHSELGLKAHKIYQNGLLVPLNSPLKTGDQIRIETQEDIKISYAWLDFVKTKRAKDHINKALKKNEKNNMIKTGYKLITHSLTSRNKKTDNNTLQKLAQDFNCKSIDELSEKIAIGDISLKSFLKKAPRKSGIRSLNAWLPKKSKDKLTIDPTESLAWAPASCCKPIPGDHVIGITGNGDGLTLHKYNCKKIKTISPDPSKWVDVQWSSKGIIITTQKLKIRLQNSPGALAKMTEQIAKTNGNITHIAFLNREQEFFDVEVSINFEKNYQKKEIIPNLLSLPEIKKIVELNK